MSEIDSEIEVDDDSELLHFILFNKKEYQLLSVEAGTNEHFTRYVVENSTSQSNVTTYIDNYYNESVFAQKLSQQMLLRDQLQSEQQTTWKTACAVLGVWTNEYDDEDLTNAYECDIEGMRIKYTLYNCVAGNTVNKDLTLKSFLFAINNLLVVLEYMWAKDLCVFDLTSENVFINTSNDVCAKIIAEAIENFSPLYANTNKDIRSVSRASNCDIRQVRRSINSNIINLRCTNVVDLSELLSTPLVTFQMPFLKNVCGSVDKLMLMYNRQIASLFWETFFPGMPKLPSMMTNTVKQFHEMNKQYINAYVPFVDVKHPNLSNQNENAVLKIVDNLLTVDCSSPVTFSVIKRAIQPMMNEIIIRERNGPLLSESMIEQCLSEEVKYAQKVKDELEKVNNDSDSGKDEITDNESTEEDDDYV